VSTSLERTYRYLRIGIAGTVVAIFAALVQAATTVGWLTSVSDYFYTPARDVFVGALVAASLALFALSGRGAERALLDAAALFAPLIALVPTTLAAGSVPGVVVPCSGRCFPPAYEADAANGVIVYLVLGVLTLLVAFVLAALGQVSLASVWPSLLIAVVVLAATALTWAFARDAFLQQAHFVATMAFFALFAAAAVRSAFPRRGPQPTPVFRVLYTAIAVGLVLVLVAYVVLLPQAGGSATLIVEAAALALFFAFWVVQGVEKWSDPDPSIIAA
jgi:FtsH-binding integral membrane protein